MGEITLTLVKTCFACPEQYDVFDGSKQVGYLRLRHGHFTADYPDSGGRLVYEADTNGDGMFDFDERDYHLNRAKAAILAELAAASPPQEDRN